MHLKKTWFLVILLGFPLEKVRAAEINLTPLQMMVESDGPPQPRYYFQDGTRRLGFRIDPKMAVHGSAASASFQFSDLRAASARLSKSTGPADLPFDKKGIETYRLLARALVPADATDVQVVEEKPGAIFINSWKSIQFVYSYKLFGFIYQRAVTFLNWPGRERLVFEVAAKPEDFKNAYARAYQVLNSIYPLPLVLKSGTT